MTIRVLEIIPTLVRGGAEKQLSLLATGLPRDEFDVHVNVLTHSGPYEATLRSAGIPVTLIGKKWKIDPAAYWKLQRSIRRLQPDLVHTWLFAANAYGRQAAFAAGIKHVVAGERCVDRWKVWHEFAIDRRLARKTSKIVTNSSGVRDFYVEHGLAAEKFVVIPNGIEPSPNGTVTRAELLQELGLPDDAKLIAAVGRLWPQKRYKDVLWAAELLKAVRDDAYVLIIGDGPQRDALESFCADIHLQDRVRFLGQRDDVQEILPLLDCFWLGSSYEGQSNAMMEAMAAGIPVVATDIPGNRDLVVPEQTGYLVAIGDAAGMAQKTQFLLNDPQLAQQFSQAAQTRMRTEFSVAKMVQRHADLYRKVVL